MGKFLVCLIFGCAVLVVALGVTHLMGMEMPDLPLGLTGIIYVAVIVGGGLSLHRLIEGPGQ